MHVIFCRHSTRLGDCSVFHALATHTVSTQDEFPAHAGSSISTQWLDQLAKSAGRPLAPLAFRMSTKSSTSVISSYSIKKPSSLEQCSKQLHDYWSCFAKGQSHHPFFFSHTAELDSWILKLFFCSTWNKRQLEIRGTGKNWGFTLDSTQFKNPLLAQAVTN